MAWAETWWMLYPEMRCYGAANVDVATMIGLTNKRTGKH